MHEVRIHLGHMSALWRDVLTALFASRPDVTVKAAPDNRGTADANCDADTVVISTCPPNAAEPLLELFQARPARRIIVIVGDGRETFLCQPLGPLTLAGFVDLVRQPP